MNDKFDNSDDMQRHGTNWDDLIREAREAFAAAAPGNVRLSDADVVAASLSTFIGQCQGKLVPVEQIQLTAAQFFASGMAETLIVMGYDVKKVDVSDGTFTAYLRDGGEIAVPLGGPAPAEVPSIFREAFEENDHD